LLWKLAANKKNRLVDELIATADSPSEDESTEPNEPDASSVNLQPGLLGINRDKYLIEFIDPVDVDDQTLADLSDRVRAQNLYAFVEIPVAALLIEDEVDQSVDQANDAQKIRFFAMDSSFSEARPVFRKPVDGLNKWSTMKFDRVDY